REKWPLMRAASVGLIDAAPRAHDSGGMAEERKNPVRASFVVCSTRWAEPSTGRRSLSCGNRGDQRERHGTDSPYQADPRSFATMPARSAAWPRIAMLPAR